MIKRNSKGDVMNLKKRLILANASTVIIPMLITVLIALASLYIFDKILGMDLTFENYQRLYQIKYDLLYSETSILRHNPKIIEEETFQKQLQQQLARINGKIVLLKDEQVIFTSDNFSKIDIAKFLEAGDRSEPVGIGNVTYTVQLIDLKFKDGANGNVLLLAPRDGAVANLKIFLGLMGIVFLLTYLLTNIIVTRVFSSSIIKPLQNLQMAATEISRGNLDHLIAEEGDQEIRALCQDLELMRIKLKDSVHTQLKYEDNRKMLVSSISHDLKTPVTSIKGYVEGILDGIADAPDKMERYLKTIAAKAYQIDQMIDDLLLYAKLDLNQIPFDFERTNVEKYLKLCILDSEPEFESYKIKISLHNQLSQKQQYVSIDRERMTRVIMNILDNARRYMHKEQKEIKILLRDTSASIIIELRDNGSGIKEEDLPHIFDRFYRSDPARKKGSGLGLAIAKQIIEGHNGKIWAVGHGEEGTSIMISLGKS